MSVASFPMVFLDTIVEPVAQVIAQDLAAIAIAAAAVCPFVRRRRLGFVGWLLLYVACDDAIAMLPILLHWNPGRWNWIGMTASLVFALAVARRWFTAGDVGLRLPRTKAEIGWSIAGIAGAIAIALWPAIVGPGTRPDLETFAYEATLPGPVEELVFRGIGLALLLRAFSLGKDDRIGTAAAVAVTAIWFTSGHVFGFGDGRFTVRWDRMLDVLPMSVWYAVVRLRSGSLLGGTLAHNAANTLVETIAAIRF